MQWVIKKRTSRYQIVKTFPTRKAALRGIVKMKNELIADVSRVTRVEGTAEQGYRAMEGDNSLFTFFVDFLDQPWSNRREKGEDNA